MDGKIQRARAQRRKLLTFRIKSFNRDKVCVHLSWLPLRQEEHLGGNDAYSQRRKAHSITKRPKRADDIDKR